MRALTATPYEQQRYFPMLDGVRAVAVLIVLTHHLPEKSVWRWLNGFAGVQEFFVLSGFLITTICVREMRRNHRQQLSLRGFYIRRVFRILPLYVLTLAAYAIATGSGWLPSWHLYAQHIGYYLAMSGELIRDQGPFQHSWTLGVEEKFYVLWPLVLVLAVPALMTARRAWFGLLLALIVAAIGFGKSDYVALYVPITCGCALAFVLDDPRWRTRLRRLTSINVLLWVLLVATVAVHLALRRGSLSAPYAALVAAVIGCLMLRPDWSVATALSSRPARWVGRRSYAIYLIHPLVITAIGVMIAPSTSAPVTITVRLVLALLVTFAIADVLHRTVELPMIRRGRLLAKPPRGRLMGSGGLQQRQPAEEHAIAGR